MGERNHLVVLASGNGSNFQSILDQAREGKPEYDIAALLTDQKEAFARQRARKAGIPDKHIDPQGKDREAFDRELAKVIDTYGPDLIVLAGFMRILSPWFVRKYLGRIINIHPALLPRFPGKDGYGDAWRSGEPVSGCTVHFVDEGVDTGPIILQCVNPREPEETFQSFKERGLSIEHACYPRAIRMVLEGKATMENSKNKTE